MARTGRHIARDIAVAATITCAAPAAGRSGEEAAEIMPLTALAVDEASPVPVGRRRGGRAQASSNSARRGRRRRREPPADRYGGGELRARHMEPMTDMRSIQVLVSGQLPIAMEATRFEKGHRRRRPRGHPSARAARARSALKWRPAQCRARTLYPYGTSMVDARSEDGNDATTTGVGVPKPVKAGEAI